MEQDGQGSQQRRSANRPPARRGQAQKRKSASAQQRPAARKKASSSSRGKTQGGAQRRPQGQSNTQGARRPQASAARSSRPSATRKPAQQRKRASEARSIVDVVRPWIPLAGMVLAALLLVLCVVRLVSCVRGFAGRRGQDEWVAQEGAPAFVIPSFNGRPRALLLDGGRRTDTGAGRMSFAAVGDNLVNENILSLADGWGGSADDGVYDFTPLYDQVRDELAVFDVTFVNQETTLGGLEVGDYSGYPSYNTPDSMAEAVVDTGFRVVNTNTNHTYDYWTRAIEYSHQVWSAYDNIVTIGSYTDQKDRDTIRVVECNGVRVAFLSYCYGQNGYEQADLPNDYYAVPFSEEALAKDVQEARKVAHGVVVYLHMGDEYVNEPSETEVAWAQACANNNVDLMIASHAHVIQPMRELTRADGKSMLAVYGMGDFVSGYEDYPETVLSGMFSCTFVRAKGGGVNVEDPVWHPLIEHREDTTDAVYLVRNYSSELANRNYLLRSLESPYDWIIETTRGVMGDNLSVDIRPLLVSSEG